MASAAPNGKTSRSSSTGGIISKIRSPTCVTSSAHHPETRPQTRPETRPEPGLGRARRRRPETAHPPQPWRQPKLTISSRQLILTNMSQGMGLAEAASGADPASGLHAARELRELAERLEALQVHNARHHG